MKKIKSSKITEGILNKFLKLTPEEQARQIINLPSDDLKISAVEKILFQHELVRTIGLVPAVIVAKTLAQNDHAEDELALLVKQPYFSKIWQAMSKKIYPSEFYKKIPTQYLVSTLRQKVQKLHKIWYQVEEILSLFDDYVVSAYVHNLPHDDEDDDKRENIRKIEKFKSYETQKESKNEYWIISVFQGVTPDVKAELLASIQTKESIRKLMGLFATFTSAADISNFLDTILMGNYEQNSYENGGVDPKMFAESFSNMVRQYNTPAVVVKEILWPIQNYDRLLTIIVEELPTGILLEFQKIWRSLRLSDKQRKLLRGNVGFSDIKKMLDGYDVPDIVAKKIKSFSTTKKLELIV